MLYNNFFYYYIKFKNAYWRSIFKKELIEFPKSVSLNVNKEEKNHLRLTEIQLFFLDKKSNNKESEVEER